MVDFTQPVSCTGGHGYLIQYSLIDPKDITDDTDILNEVSSIYVFNIVLNVVDDNNNHQAKGINSYRDLLTIASYLYDFLESNRGAAFYFFCDDKEIYINGKSKIMSCQEFRSALFSKLFNVLTHKRGCENYRNLCVEINTLHTIYYTHLICHKEDFPIVKKISDLLYKMSK